MRHQKKGRKFSRKKDLRKALIKSLARELFLNERIKTTLPKAKELRPFAEKLITKAKKDNVATIRYLKRFFDEEVVFKLVKEIAPRFMSRPGGYTRIIHLPPRRFDSAEMSVIELVEKSSKDNKKKK